MMHSCPACGTANDAWRPFCTKCSLRLDGARHGPPGTAGSALDHYRPVGAAASVDKVDADHAGEGAGARRSTHGRARAALAVLALAAIAGTAVGGIEVAQHRSATPFGDRAVAPPRHWDPRLEPLAHVAENLRGLTFKHPVAARFYTDAEFNHLNTDDFDKPQSRAELTQLAAELRALGIAPAHLDLASAAKTLVASTSLAFYDPATKRISVRGTDLDVAHDVTIVHELTHALQDQYFDLQAMQHKADTSQSDSVTALIEGDARDVEERYVDTLTASRKAEYDAEEQRLDESVTGKVASVPDALVLSEQAPYDLGERFVRALRFAGGTAALNRAFREPPESDWYIVDPVAYMNRSKVARVPRPQLPSGAKLLDDQGETGDFGLFLMLAERIDAHAALAASDAWRGDHTVLYTLRNTTCVDLDIAARDTPGRNIVESALEAWSAQMPARDTSVHRIGTRRIDLRACDGGARTPALTHRSVRAYSLPVTRSELLDTFLGQGADAATAWCTADQVVYGYSVADLDDPTGAAFSKPEFLTRLKAWITACQAST